MSHELRTPLNAVLGFAQLLRLDATRPPTIEQLGRIQHIENAGRTPARARQRRPRPVARRIGTDDGLDGGRRPPRRGGRCARHGVAPGGRGRRPLPGLEPERRRDRRRGGSRRRPASGLGPRRQVAHAAGAGQPPQQRGQVQPHRRQRQGRLGGQRRARLGPHRRHRPRHDLGEARAPVRALQPPRRREVEHRGDRHRPRAVASPRRADGGRPPDHEHARPRHGRHARPQGDRPARGAARPAGAAEPARLAGRDLAGSLRRGRRSQRRADPPGGRAAAERRPERGDERRARSRWRAATRPT